MNVDDAIYHSVHDYPGGAEALAPRMGLRPPTLRKMSQPGSDSHGWSLRRFRQLLAFAGLNALHSLCEEHGGIFVPMGRFADLPQGKLLRTVSTLAREFGDVPRAIESSLKGDGRISGNELAKIERECAELVSAASAVVAVARQLHAQHTRVPEEDRP